MKNNLLIILFISVFFSCKKSKNETDASTLAVSKIDTTRITIFKYDNTDKECEKIFPAGKNSRLEDVDLIKIEDALKLIIGKQNTVQVKRFKEYSKNYLKENYTLQDFIIKDKNYIRRYLVIENSHGEKEIYVNLICDEIAKELDWKKYLSDGHGGGSCLFSFKLNLTTNTYYDVYFHAEA